MPSLSLSRAPGSLADALRTYFVAFVPLADVDDALREVAARSPAGADDVDRIATFRIASGVLHERARLTREVEALVLAMEARLGVHGAADVLGIEVDEVEAVLLEVAAAETSELPVLTAAPTTPAGSAPRPQPVIPGPVTPGPADPESVDPAPVVAVPAVREPAGATATSAAAPPDDPEPASDPAPDRPVVDAHDAPVAASGDSGGADEVAEARRGRTLAAVGLGIAVLLAVGLLLLGRPQVGFSPSGASAGIVRVEDVVTIDAAVLGSGDEAQPPERPVSELAAGGGAALHLRYAEERAGLGDALGVVWYRDEAELYRSSWRLAEPLGSWRAELPPHATTAAGSYRADVVVNGSVVHSVPFVVMPNEADASGEPAAPAG